MNMSIINRILGKPTLEYILKFAIKHNACEAQLTMYKRFIEGRDNIQAWQTVLGNIYWLRAKGLRINQKYLETNAQYVGKVWWGWNKYIPQFIEEIWYQDKVRFVKMKKYNTAGKLIRMEIYKNDKLHSGTFYGHV